jgi:hypothetical protein
MNISLFKDPNRYFSIVLFLDHKTLEEQGKHLEALSNQKNVRLIVQPTSFEAITFLYQIEDEILGHFESIEDMMFWKAIEIRKTEDPSVLEKIGSTYHEYIVSILEHNIDAIKANTFRLQNLSKHSIKPLLKKGLVARD